MLDDAVFNSVAANTAFGSEWFCLSQTAYKAGSSIFNFISFPAYNWKSFSPRTREAKSGVLQSVHFVFLSIGISLWLTNYFILIECYSLNTGELVSLVLAWRLWWWLEIRGSWVRAPLANELTPGRWLSLSSFGGRRKEHQYTGNRGTASAA